MLSDYNPVLNNGVEIESYLPFHLCHLLMNCGGGQWRRSSDFTGYCCHRYACTDGRRLFLPAISPVEDLSHGLLLRLLLQLRLRCRSRRRGFCLEKLVLLMVVVTLLLLLNAGAQQIHRIVFIVLGREKDEPTIITFATSITSISNSKALHTTRTWSS